MSSILMVVSPRNDARRARRQRRPSSPALRRAWHPRLPWGLELPPLFRRREWSPCLPIVPGNSEPIWRSRWPGHWLAWWPHDGHERLPVPWHHIELGQRLFGEHQVRADVALWRPAPLPDLERQQRRESKGLPPSSNLLLLSHSCQPWPSPNPSPGSGRHNEVDIKTCPTTDSTAHPGPGWQDCNPKDPEASSTSDTSTTRPSAEQRWTLLHKDNISEHGDTADCEDRAGVQLLVVDLLLVHLLQPAGGRRPSNCHKFRNRGGAEPETAAEDDQEPWVRVHQQEEEEGVRDEPGGPDQGALLREQPS